LKTSWRDEAFIKNGELEKNDWEYYIDTPHQGNTLVTAIGLLQGAGLINPASLSSQYNKLLHNYDVCSFTVIP
ncbi:hypothetical protein, partial [Methanoregula sp.]|uniref:hypothetical protein n=1 Tax=Methanoregula sp. TaxID=2052170 RepID=UPI003C365173